MNITRTLVAERDRALLGGDYGDYHARTTRRIRTLRKRLGVATPRGRKYTPQSPVTAAEIGQNVEWAYLLLANAERAWADAMSMKSKQSPENTQKPMAGSTKRQIVSRFRKAIGYATSLVDALADQGTSKASSTDLLEAKAYLALLRGGLHFEKNQWPRCIEDYSFVRVVYSALGAATKQEIYKDLLANTVDPSVRYAAYQERLPRTKAVPDIAIEKFPPSEASSRSDILGLDSTAFETTQQRISVQTEGAKDLPSSIEWRGRVVKLEDATISQALGLAKGKEEALSETYTSYRQGSLGSKELATAYEDVITARQDAVDACKTAIDELGSEGVEQSDPRIQSLQITRTALNFGVIEWRVGRNRVLCGPEDGMILQPKDVKQRSTTEKNGTIKAAKVESSGRQLAKLRERVALYDSIIQNLDAAKQLPGVMADEELLKDLDAKHAYFRALKCLAIAQSHAINDQIRNALALYAQANELVSRSTGGLKQSPKSAEQPTKMEITSSELQTLQKRLESWEIQYRALAELKSLNGSKPSQGRAYAPPLLETLHSHRYEDDLDLKNIVNYPPRMRPVPLQPLFFDLAWNYIQYPGKEGVVPAAAVAVPVNESKAEEAPKKKGWFGFGR